VAGQGFVAEEQVDSAISSVAALEASLKADEAAIESARLRLGFCDIRAPISGVVGGLKLHRGNLVKANDNDRPLVTILQIQPLHVAFALPERHLSDIRRFMAKGPLPVSAGLPGQEADAVQGELAFIENAVDSSTGSIPLRAVFPNTDRRLWPGQFVNVTLTLAEEKEAVVVPVQAVQNGQQGPYLYVLQDDQTVAYRPVEAGRRRDGLMVINAGVAAGEQVVLEGHLRLAAGSRVKAVSGGKSP